ncbi:unnamed protein product [marine sediment metagenome]|uniref:Uncharacterized protein n=1 Tax=marine sediment metagenome TaxID=412755 RepID=X1TA24_9ZZZZ
MVYVVIKPKTETTNKLGCVVKAVTGEEACRMVGVKSDEVELAMFTDAELQAMNDTVEGYVSGSI